MELEKVQGNDLFKAIEEVGLDPSECELADNRKLAGLNHLPTGSHFNIKHSRWSAGKYSVDRIVAAGPWDWLRGLEWEGVLDAVRKWATEVIAPDLWSEVQRAKEAIAHAQSGAGSSNDPFTHDEQVQVSDQIKAVKNHIQSEYEPSDERMAHIEATLDEVEEASKRIGRKDWLMAFNGAVFSMILSDVIPPQAAQHVLMMTFQGLGHLFGIAGAPPSIPPVA